MLEGLETYFLYNLSLPLEFFLPFFPPFLLSLFLSLLHRLTLRFI